jgi:hypothetical protein
VRVDLPVTPAETCTLVWLRPAVSPEGDTAVEREIVPTKLSTPLRVRSVAPEELGTIVKLVDPGEIVKSTTLTDTIAE